MLLAAVVVVVVFFFLVDGGQAPHPARRTRDISLRARALVEPDNRQGGMEEMMLAFFYLVFTRGGVLGGSGGAWVRRGDCEYVRVCGITYVAHELRTSLWPRWNSVETRACWLSDRRVFSLFFHYSSTVVVVRVTKTVRENHVHPRARGITTYFVHT